MNLSIGSCRPPEDTEQILKANSYLESRVYHFIIGYMNITIIDLDVKSHFDRVTEFTTIEELKVDPRKLLKDSEELYPPYAMPIVSAGLIFFLPLR